MSYFLNVISELSKETEIFKYFSIFTLTDIRNVILDTKINSIMIVITFVLSVILVSLTLIRYNKQELV